MDEEWRTLPSDTRYKVSSHGRMIGPSGKLLQLKINQKRAYVSRNPGQIPVHRSVMEAFVGPRPRGMDICHNDGNSLNNHLSNLRYDTHKANFADTLLHGTRARGRKLPQTKLDESQVQEIRKRLEAGEMGAQLAEQFGVCRATITWIKKRRNWSYVH